MRKKITMLLASLFLCMGAWAQLTVGSVYSIQNRGTKNAISQDAACELATVETNIADNAQLWIAENGTVEGTVMFRNLASGRYAQSVNQTYTHWYTDYVECNFYVGEMAAAAEGTPAYYYISREAISDAASQHYSVMHQSNGYVVQWEQTNNNSQWAFVEVAVEASKLAEITETWKEMASAKTKVVNELTNLAKLSIYADAQASIEAVNAVKATGTTVAELCAASESINAILANCKKQIDGKSVVFDNNASDVRKGLSVTATGGKAYGTASEGDETIWTIKMQDNGSFKLYNFVTDKYLNEPGNMNLVDESGAAAYNFIVTGVDKVALVVGRKMLHQANYWGPTNYDLLNWYDLNDAASIWTLTEKGIKISREQYDLASAAKEILPYAIQQAYGLVTDANQYYSNYKSTAEGSYEALLDNQESSFFHSAYGDEPGDGSGVHYIQADLGDGNSVDEFYFYMKPRSGNGNNRPKNVTVYGSNDNVEFTKIAEVTTTLDGSMTPYVSEKLGAEGTNYRYIRLTVTSTNTSTTFFTLSELYFFPAQSDVTNLVDSYNAFASSSITSEDMATAATALINAEGTLALSNIKKEIAALLSANESNHAAAPELGQYTTEAYDALNAAYVATDATQESLEAAIAAFKKSLNAPVYFITSKHKGYAAGSAIYYDGAWKWKKPANIYDRQMWMTIPGYTEENVPVVDAYDANGTSYAICDYLTGTKMRGKDVQIVKVADWEGAYNLQYNANANSTDAAQHAKDNGQLVNWKPGTSTDAQASVWGVEYIGNTYDLDKLTDEHIAALGSLKSAYGAKAFYADAVLGEGLGQYKGKAEDKAAIVATLAPAEAILNGTLTEQANATVDAINDAAAAINEVAGLEINLPETGKFYRFQGACEASLPGYYITGHTNADGGRIALTAEEDASTIYYFDGTNLTAYQSGLVVGLNSSHWTFASIGDNSKPASTIIFAGSPRQAGKYTIKSADRYFHYTVYNNTVQVNRCENDDCAEHDWNITEVTELPVAVSAAGFATLYAPVALTIADGVTAYTAAVKDETLVLNEVEGTIPANTGVILEADPETYNFAVAADVAAIEGNALVGSYAKSVKNAEAKVYTLQAPKDKEVGFYLFKGQDAEGKTTYINGFRAWVEVAEGEEAPAMFTLGRGGEEDEDTTGIDQLINNGEVVIYDLAGRRVEKMEKGIYIVNGKKVIR